ncbi:MAG: translation initiation factor IF-6 [Candidatus Diapherotrites archaeon]
MNLDSSTIHSSPYVGVYAIVSEKIALVPHSISKKESKILENALQVEIVSAQLAGTELLGVLGKANSHGIIVSGIVEKEEIDKLKEIGLNAGQLDNELAVGNLVACNDSKAIVSPLLSAKDKKLAEKVLKVEVSVLKIAGSELCGSALVVSNTGFVCHGRTTEAELKQLEQALNLKGIPSTANYGDPFVGNAVIANSQGVIVGEHTTSFEILRIEEGLEGKK